MASVRAPTMPGEGEPTALGRRVLNTLGSCAHWIVPALYLAAALIITRPFLTHAGTTLVAPIGGDVSSSVSKWGALALEPTLPFAPGTTTAINWPTGMPTTPALELAGFLSASYYWLSTMAIGPLAAHSLLGVLGYALTATVTFLFVRQVSGSTAAGLVAGTAYGFFPHLQAMVWAATTYSHMWLFILPIWAFWSLARAPSRRRALLAGLAYLPALFWTPYFALHAFVVSVACLAVVLFVRGEGPRRWKARSTPLVVAPWLAGVTAYVGIGVASGFADVPARPLEDAYTQAAHPFMYVFPGRFSGWGERPGQLLTELVPRAAGVNLYVGVSCLLLGSVAVVAHLLPWLRSRSRVAPSPLALATLMALVVVLACLVCSLPPRVAGNRVPTPNLVIFELVSSLRAGQRFVMPLMAGIAILAGLGAHQLLRRLPAPLVPAVAVVLALVVGYDLRFSPQPGRVTTLPESPALASLREAPHAPVLFVTETGGVSAVVPQVPCVWQAQFEKPVLNSCGITVPSPLLAELAALGPCRVVAGARRGGARYLFAYRESAVHRCLAAPRRRARVLARDAYFVVYDLRRGGA